jgi:hypothetical protein
LCGVEKPLTQFYRNGKDKYGRTKYRSECKTCHKILKKISKKKHNKFKNNTRNRGAKDVLTFDEWKEILIHWQGRCAYCGKEPKGRGQQLTKEHVVPLSKGGASTKNNIILACISCNCSKSNEDLIDWYHRQKFFNKERLRKILDWIGR